MQSESERAGYGGSFITVSMPPGAKGKDADYDNSKRRRNTSLYRVRFRFLMGYCNAKSWLRYLLQKLCVLIGFQATKIYVNNPLRVFNLTYASLGSSNYMSLAHVLFARCDVSQYMTRAPLKCSNILLAFGLQVYRYF